MRPGTRRSRWLLGAAMAGLIGWIAGCGGDQPTQSGNLPPRIVSVNASPGSVILGGESRVTTLVSDPNNDPLVIRWHATGGVFTDSTRTSTFWRAPGSPGLYVLTLSASDGQETVADSVSVACGNVSLTVESTPSHAFINLDGTPTGLQTPYTFDPLPVGFHSASLFSLYYKYAGLPGVDLAHGASDTLRFVLPPPEFEVLDPGRNDLLEVGGVAVLPSGLGIVFAGRTASDTALYSTPLFPTVGTPRGVRIAGPVRIEEPIAIGGTGPDLFFVTSGESLAVVAIRDRNQDGAVDSVGRVVTLRKGFSPGASSTDAVAYALTPSEDPGTITLFYASYANGILSPSQLATPNGGKFPTWEPGDDVLAYQHGDAIFRGILNPGSIPLSDALYSLGFNTAPSWGPWGARTLGFLHGELSGAYTDLMLTAVGAPDAITVYRSLQDPRFLAWSNLERAVVITQDPAGLPQILVLRDLPIP
jgi:PEGA domain-containing protein